MSHALIDSGCETNLLNRTLAIKLCLREIMLKKPIEIITTIGEDVNQKIGHLVSITEQINLVIGDHFEHIQFGITNCQKRHSVILGMPWLSLHNPDIDWTQGILHFRCKCVLIAKSINIVTLQEEEKSFGIQDTDTIILDAAFASGADNIIPTEIPQEYRKWSKIFDEQLSTVLPPHRPGFDCALDLKDSSAVPPYLKLIPLDAEKDQLMKNFLLDQESKGWIRTSKSPCAAPVFFVKKHPKGWRNCTDYRALNQMLIKNRCPLPLINDMIDKLNNKIIFTKIDLRNAYNQLRIKEGDEWKTAFITKYGLYETLVMNFGICNAPAVFQAWMNHIFRDLLDVYVMVYLDDIIIFSNDTNTHIVHVQEVLDRLESNKCWVRLSKCVFNVTEVEFVGFKINQQGLFMCHKKTKAIEDWPIPRSKTEILSFLGFLNFYRRFIKGFSQIAYPLTDLTKKDAKFHWSLEASTAFKQLKYSVTIAPILRHIDVNKPFIVETDASYYATGAVLIQKDNNTGFPHPVAFISKKFSDTELRYATYDKELFAIIRAFTTWRHYLLSSKFENLVFTDHNNLRYFRTKQLLSAKQMGWSMILSEFNFKLEHKAGINNQVADALSRRSDHTPSDEDLTNSKAETLLTDDKFLEIDDSYSDIIVNIGVHNVEDKTEDGEDETPLDDFSIDKQRIITDESEKLLITQMRHDSVVAGHYGIAKTVDLIRRDFNWPKLIQYVKNYVKSCDCQRNKPVRHKPYGKLMPFPFSATPWTQVSLDFIVKLPKSDNFDSILVICDRGMTKMVHFIPCSESITAEETADLYMKHVFKLHGLPSEIISDRGPQFSSTIWHQIMKDLKVIVKLSTSFHPQTDGQSERSNQTLEQYLRNYVNYSQNDWIEYLHYAEFAFNNAVHEGIGISPFKAMTGYNPRADFLVLPKINQDDNDLSKRLSFLKQLQKELQTSLIQAQQRYKFYADKHRLDSPFKVGDKVWLISKNIRSRRPSRKLNHKRMGPYEIESKINEEVWKLKLPYSMKQIHPVFHSSLLEPFHANNIENRIIEPPEPEEIDGEIEWEVDEILDSRKHGRGVQYFVKWLNRPGEDSWQPSRDLLNCNLKVLEFHKANVDKPIANVFSEMVVKC